MIKAFQKKIPTSFFIAVISFFIWNCSSVDPVIAGSSDTEVGGEVALISGMPAPGARVDLIPEGFTPGKSDTTVKQVTTDKNGHFVFQNVANGIYTVIGRNSVDSSSFLSFKVAIEKGKNLGSFSLKKSGAIKTSVSYSPLNNNTPVFIVGTNIVSDSIIVENGKSYAFLDQVPIGNSYDLALLPKPDPDIVTLVSEKVEVKESITTVVKHPYEDWHYSLDYRIPGDFLGIRRDTLEALQLLFELDSNFAFAQASPFGNDIRFEINGIANIPFEIESWSQVEKKAVIWVKYTNLALGPGSTNYLRLYWGNPNAVDRSRSESVYDRNLNVNGAWHMHQESSVLRDLTFFQNHGLSSSMPLNVEGVIGQGQKFNGRSNYVSFGNDSALSLGHRFSISVWVKLNDAQQNRKMNILSKRKSGMKDGYELGCTTGPDSGSLRLSFSDSSSLIAKVKWTTDWTLIHATMSRDSCILYVNGQRQAQTYKIPTLNYEYQTPLIIGAGSDSSSGFFNGSIDEVRIDRFSFSESRIQFTYENQKPNRSRIQPVN